MKTEELGEQALGAACRGELRALDEAVASLEVSLAAEKRSDAPLWRAVLLSARELVDPELIDPELPGGRSPAEVLEGDGPAELVARGCAHRVRRAFVQWDGQELRRWATRLAALEETPRVLRERRRADAWFQLMAGEVGELEALGRSLYSEGSRAQDASLVIDATLLRAMAALTRDEMTEAIALSRRASRMARTEGLRAERILASIVLARVRRRAGRPHLATRILASMAPVAPLLWHGWLRWERLLAAGAMLKGSGEPATPTWAPSPHSPAHRASSGLWSWLMAAQRGEREAFEKHRDVVVAEVAGFRDLAQECGALAAALDPQIPVSKIPERLRQWAIGEVDETPVGLHGIVGPPDGPADSTIACVVCVPGGVQVRRLLRVATPLLAAEGPVLRLERTRLRRGRVDTAIAALALAGEQGLPDAVLFEKAYEFEFVPSLHAGILDVLVHRMRSRLEGAGVVHRGAGLLRLEAAGILVLPDPRCVEHVEDRLLRVIARHGAITTRQAAKELDVSVRTAQLALRRLLTEGECVLNRDGRRVQYLVEDTTFTEPTRF